MTNFIQGQMIVLKSNRSVEGAVIAVLEGSSETRYQVFTNSLGMQTYYESQIEAKDVEESIEEVDGKRFHAGLTASLIRNPSLSSLYSLNTARIDLIPHQFRPVLKFIRSDRPRLLIADGVGVGKTIEAGLILKELEARRNINSVLIICPRPLITERKWENEMKRFDEEFVAVDGEKLRYCINELYMEGEWPSNSSKVVMPYSLFDRNNIYGVENGRRDQRGLMNVDPPKFDLVIVDEAHHIRNTDTFAYKAVSRFVDNAEAVLFLTATPVQLEYDDLFVLLNLLRPDYVIDKTFTRGNEDQIATIYRYTAFQIPGDIEIRLVHIPGADAEKPNYEKQRKRKEAMLRWEASLEKEETVNHKRVIACGDWNSEIENEPLFDALSYEKLLNEVTWGNSKLDNVLCSPCLSGKVKAYTDAYRWGQTSDHKTVLFEVMD